MNKEKIKSLYNQHQRYVPALFFVSGFLFDIFTLDRIDNPLFIVQQAIYLAVISRLIYYKNLEQFGLWSVSERFQKVWHYQNEILHFLLGSLLSAYTLFYFLSASLSTSLIFMILMGLVLVANELPALQKQSLAIKSGLFYLCLASFLSFVVPIILQFVSLITLLIALALTFLVAWTTRKALLENEAPKSQTDRNLLVPAGSVIGTLLVLYILKVLPPLPLSVQYMGVYHDVKKQNDQYALFYERPFWKFWQNGAQDFVAQPGDKVHVFARVFSPATMDDEVVFRWQQFIRDQWQTSDIVKIRVVGGRSEGFRAYAVKSNFQAGEWRVKIETTDGREMGRISFEISTAPPSEREFKVDLQ